MVDNVVRQKRGPIEPQSLNVIMAAKALASDADLKENQRANDYCSLGNCHADECCDDPVLYAFNIGNDLIAKFK